ncbi:biofilm formation regulator HmsP [Erwinia amylovora]|uniref:Protein yhjK n=4 Tax=Erwinia amylovora TaxID=552 RepID=A0A830ZYW4_ERWAM|nr:biofilm formation regulator HmsP [Erwinia amylovora]CBX82504.1 Protein yhjK [Erwinia amylovora ATCC BAA-2158]CDK16892.1 Protein yhjK [Erwinia amylovora LA635]CDK20260.1 Protein yhjK [Erwinia amylovora LA636]CDK23631.1 Protein yhjK [Erwinia amylovora LA637]ATZ13108.1 phosphodiesterase [Erwinia amylovora]
MRVSRSLKIKQMATISSVALVTVCIFIVIQLFHFVQQRRIDYAQQMENVAHTVRQPLSQAVLKADIPQAELILNSLRPAGILARAEVLLPNGLQALHTEFAAERPIPHFIARLFELPVQITVPLYSVEPANPKPLAFLVLQADSWRVYQFILSAVSTMVTAYLLLALILSVSISWCINRLIVRPLRNIANALQDLTPQQAIHHQLLLPKHHRNDEIGLLIRNYNRNQQALCAMHDEMSRQSTRFTLTDLPNQTLFLAMLEQHLRAIGRSGVFTVMVLRIETLLETNGLVTDERRDALLLTLVSKIRSCIDERTVLAQLSIGDFALLIKRANNPFRALRLARTLMLKLNQPVLLQHMQLRPNISIGIAQREAGFSAPELLARAVSAMMSARHQGKNQILFFDVVLAQRAQKRLTQEHDILQGLAEEKFALWLQPQVDMRSGQLVGAEALLRMRQPDGSWSLPEDLIANAEEIGVIAILGRWVFEESCRILAQWQQRGCELTLSVNLSAIQLREAAMVTHLQALIQRYGIRAGSLVLEITETAQIGEPEQALLLLQELQKTGVAVALDDFGMGYANLNWLNQFKTLPIGKLKMDRSFVTVLPYDDTMVRIIAAIAEIVKLDVIAEGVETDEQRARLLACGIHFGQGYLYAGALPLAQFNQRYLASY